MNENSKLMHGSLNEINFLKGCSFGMENKKNSTGKNCKALYHF